MSDFSSLGLSQPLLDAIAELGFVEPTPIQQEAIPFLLAGDRDLVGLAQTGTGKTAAFGLPLIDRMDLSMGKPLGLVLAPTRELCLQITKELQLFARFRPMLNITAVYGGADIWVQMKQLKAGSQLVVATPGRLRDLIKRRAIQLDSITTVVLDEADEMLNMGFKEEIDEILESVPTERRTWLFSATMPKEVQRLAKTYMHDPYEIKVGDTSQTNEDIDHQFIVARPRERLEVLRRYLDSDPELYALVFCRTRAETLSLSDDLQRDGYAVDVLNGDLSQAQRDRAMERFRSRRVRILIATDVAARGLDVQGITHVFHLNIPDDWAFYTHRSGRTGRAGEKGKSIMLIHPNDRHKLRGLDRQLNLQFNETEPPSVLGLVEHRLQRTFQNLLDAQSIPALAPLTSEVEVTLFDLSKEELIQRVAALTFGELPVHYQREALHLLDPRSSNKDHRKEKEPRKGSGKYQRMFINIGKKEVAGIPEFVEFVCFFGEIDAKAIGDVDLRDKHTFFDVDHAIAGALVKKFKGSEWEGRPMRVNFDDGPNGGKPQGGRREHGPKKDRSFAKKGSFKKRKEKKFGFPKQNKGRR
jgi:ATP-dependent RNA helicase DeaD